MEKEQKIQMTFRIPEKLFEWSKQEAARIGIPQAALLLSLIDDGRRLKNAKIILDCIEQK